MKNAIKDVPAASMEQLFPIGDLSAHWPNSIPQLRSHAKRGDNVISISAVTVWSPAWATATEESTLQAALRRMAPLLNQHSTTLYWDFSIENAATLANLKPDGHGRLGSDASYAKSIPHVAVLVELKTTKTLSDGIS